MDRKLTREDWATPEVETATKLKPGEQKAVYRELQRGGNIHQLAVYFNTSVKEIEKAKQLGEIMQW